MIFRLINWLFLIIALLSICRFATSTSPHIEIQPLALFGNPEFVFDPRIIRVPLFLDHAYDPLVSDNRSTVPGIITLPAVIIGNLPSVVLDRNRLRSRRSRVRLTHVAEPQTHFPEKTTMVRFVGQDQEVSERSQVSFGRKVEEVAVQAEPQEAVISLSDVEQGNATAASQCNAHHVVQAVESFPEEVAAEPEAPVAQQEWIEVSEESPEVTHAEQQMLVQAELEAGDAPLEAHHVVANVTQEALETLDEQVTAPLTAQPGTDQVQVERPVAAEGRPEEAGRTYEPPLCAYTEEAQQAEAAEEEEAKQKVKEDVKKNEEEVVQIIDVSFRVESKKWIIAIAVIGSIGLIAAGALEFYLLRQP